MCPSGTGVAITSCMNVSCHHPDRSWGILEGKPRISMSGNFLAPPGMKS
jgi:hypothetical protein